MAGRPADKMLRLKHILVEEAGVEERIADWLITDANGPMCESPADFAQLWTETTVADGPKVDVLALIDPPIDATTFAGRRTAGRLRTAWTFCTQDVAGDAKLRAEPPKPDDPGELQPWSDERRDSCAADVLRLYKVVFKPDQLPASNIMHRMDRLWRDRSPELLQLTRMRTQADQELILQGPVREKSLGLDCGDATLIMRQGPASLPECSLDDTDQVLQAMEVIANGWVLLNTKLEQSADTKKGMVHGFDINNAAAWVRFARKMARTARNSGESETSVVRYLRVREHQTRKAATTYWKEHQYPWGEAITKALDVDMAVLWTVTSHSNAYGIQVAIPGITDVDMSSGKRGAPSSGHYPPPPPAKYPRQEQRNQQNADWERLKSKDLKSFMLCPEFQMGACRAPCPRSLLHRCGRWLPHLNQFCGATQHGKDACNRRMDGQGGKADKGKGKGKGSKGKGERGRGPY